MYANSFNSEFYLYREMPGFPEPVFKVKIVDFRNRKFLEKQSVKDFFFTLNYWSRSL